MEVKRNDPSAGKWQDQVSNPVPLPQAQCPSSRATGRWMIPRDGVAPCQEGVNKEHEAELEKGDSDARTLRVLGSSALEERTDLFPGPYTAVAFTEVRGRGVLRLPGRFSPREHVGRNTEWGCTPRVHLRLGDSCSTPRAEPSLFPAEKQSSPREKDICLRYRSPKEFERCFLCTTSLECPGC